MLAAFRHSLGSALAVAALCLATGCTLYAGDDAPGGGSTDGGGSVAGEILVNGGFEELDATGTWVTDWNNLDGNPDGEIVVVDSPVASGNHALEWQIAAAGDGREYFIIQDQIDPSLFVRGARYEISGQYRIDRLGEDISFNYIVRGEGDEPNIGNDWDNTHPARPNEWERFAFRFTVPGNATPSNYSVYLHVIKWTQADLHLWLDNVSLHRVN